VVVYRLDRLSRNVRDIYSFLDQLRTHGVAFVSVTEGFDTTTAMGRAMLGVAAVFAQLTREMISENVRDGLLRRAEDGYFLGNPHRLHGYQFDPETRLLRLDEEQPAIIRRIFRWYREAKWGVDKIARTLNLEGVKTKRGGQWNSGTIAHILRNPIGAGRVPVKDSTVPGRHPAIISAEEFGATQELIRSRATLPPRSHQSQHLLSGLARCGKCGRRLRAHYSHYQRKSGERRQYVSYIHPRTVEVGPGACSGLSKSAAQLEQAVISAVEQLARHEDF